MMTSIVFILLAFIGALVVASLVSPISAPGITTTDYLTMVIFSALLIPLLYTGRMIHRLEGVVLLALYGAYLFGVHDRLDPKPPARFIRNAEMESRL